jgi:hypothetical protein
MRLQYAWNWFDLHAKQRMSLFSFFLIITGIFINGYATALKDGWPLVAFGAAALGAVSAVAFIALDVRSRELTRLAEDVLEKLEWDFLFPETFTSAKVRRGAPLGLLAVESRTGMREGHSHPAWARVRKMKYWIWGVEVLVALLAVAGASYAWSQMARVDSAKRTGFPAIQGSPTPAVQKP